MPELNYNPHMASTSRQQSCNQGFSKTPHLPYIQYPALWYGWYLSAYRLYEDDGESTGYLSGRGVFTPFELKENLFTVHPAEGDLAYLPEYRSFQLHFRCGISGAEVRINGVPTDIRPDGNTVELSGIKPTDRVEIQLKSR